MNATLQLSVPTLTQCKNATITWASSRLADDDKMIQVFVKGSKAFAERITGPDLSGNLGSFVWTCDFPAGSYIALQFNNRNGSVYNTQGFYQVQPGSTDACLRTNPGQLAEASMASVAASLSSASPQLFTYASTQVRSSRSIPITQDFPQTSSSPGPSPTSDAASPTSSSSSSDNSNQTAIIAATTLSAFGVFLMICAGIFYYYRRKRRQPEALPARSTKTSFSTETKSSPLATTQPTRRRRGSFLRTPSISTSGGGAIASWVHRIPFGRPPSMPNSAGPPAPPPTVFSGSVDGRDGHSIVHSTGPRMGMGEIQEESSSNGHSGEGLTWSAAPFGAVPDLNNNHSGSRLPYTSVPTYDAPVVSYQPATNPMYTAAEAHDESPLPPSSHPSQFPPAPTSQQSGHQPSFYAAYHGRNL
ncbi:hypothetical protein ACM66B_006206 [Microbotryomycetes sp. NB124-2]